MVWGRRGNPNPIILEVAAILISEERHDGVNRKGGEKASVEGASQKETKQQGKKQNRTAFQQDRGREKLPYGRLLESKRDIERKKVGGWGGR